ncbi:uncharacterized protein LOC126270104 isoform X1 [Schistocerca gregaria]|uniref:uncharacterized protein LOC126270104 isoform X1 n=1 Tax=Schistocerca gregaria TaxID=7010 RepID=UPI00211EECDF|nr:uncharacterized protein LOC126270104 isoform X1 [Schistocerca gregaria]
MPCYPWRWLSVVAIAVAAYDQEMCVLGPCLDPVYRDFTPTFGSFLLVVTVSCHLASCNLYPTSLRKLPSPLRYLYDVLAVLYLSTFAVRYLWIPMKTFAKYITALVISVVCVLDYCSCLQNNEVFNKSVEALLASEGEILVCAFIMGFLAFNYHNGLQGKKI